MAGIRLQGGFMQEIRLLLVLEDIARAFVRIADDEVMETCTVTFPGDIRAIIQADRRKGMMRYQVFLGKKSRGGESVLVQERTIEQPGEARERRAVRY